MKCLICETLDAIPCGLTRRGRRYRHCLECDLVFVETSDFLSLEAESERYKHHQNESTDAGYQRFLRQLTDKLQGVLKSGARVLDYGCGPSPVLSAILRTDYANQISSSEYFDPLFFPEKPKGVFDVITSSEVFEHFRDPRVEIRHVLSLLKDGGTLAVMTQFHQGPEHLRTWWYADDSTHVCFYSARTFDWIAGHFKLKIVFCENPIVLLQK